MASLERLPVVGAITAELRCALSLLTRLGVGATDPARSGSAAFAVVGLGLGLLAAAAPVALGEDRSLLAAVGAISVLALATGALHLDGLADTADGLAASDLPSAERARRDPAVGAAGAAAVTLVLLLDVAALATLTTAQAAAALVVAASVSRAVPALAAPWAPRSEHGFGAWFASQAGPGGAALAVATSLGVALVLPGSASKLGWLTGIAAGLIVLGLLARRFHAISGDGYGAAVEVSFAAALVAQGLAR